MEDPISPVAYYNIYRALRTPYTFQIKMVQYAHPHGVSPPAPASATTRKSVRKWLTRYQTRGTAGLHDHSKAPHCHPGKSPAPLQQQALEMRRLLPPVIVDTFLYCTGQNSGVLPQLKVEIRGAIDPGELSKGGPALPTTVWRWLVVDSPGPDTRCKPETSDTTRD